MGLCYSDGADFKGGGEINRQGVGLTHSKISLSEV